MKDICAVDCNNAVQDPTMNDLAASIVHNLTHRPGNYDFLHGARLYKEVVEC